MNIEEAKQVLRDAGYYVENLWCCDDIDRTIEEYDIKLPEGRELSDDEKYDILIESVSSESIISDIKDAIADEIRYVLEEEEEEEEELL